MIGNFAEYSLFVQTHLICKTDWGLKYFKNLKNEWIQILGYELIKQL